MIGEEVLVIRGNRTVHAKINDVCIGDQGGLYYSVSVYAAQDVDLEAWWISAREILTASQIAGAFFA